MQASNLASNNLSPFLNTPLAIGNTGSLGTLWSRQVQGNVERALGDYYSSRLRGAAAPAMDSAIGMLEEAAGGAFQARSVTSTNPDAVTGTAADGAFQASYVVSVSQLATGQDVISSRFKAQDTNSVGHGTYSFLINIDNQDVRFDVKVNGTDTNEAVLQKISDEINSAGLGVQASVQYNPTEQTAWLNVSGVQTGQMHSYTMRDDGGNLLDSLGVSTARYATGETGGLTQAADNALFSINGTEFESDSNNVALFENSVALQFKKTTLPPGGDAVSQYAQNGGSASSIPGTLYSSNQGVGGREGDYQATVALKGAGTVRIDVRPDAQKIANNIVSFVQNSQNLNSTLSQAMEQNYRTAGSHISKEFSRNADALRELGIENNNGHLSVSREKLLDNIQTNPDKVEQVFGGPAGLARGTIFSVQRAVYAPFAATSWVTSSPSAAASAGFFQDKTV